MATMNISLPDPMREWVSERVDSGVYANASDYVRDLIRRDQELRDRLVAEIDKGLNSGISDKTIPDIIADMQRRHGAG